MADVTVEVRHTGPANPDEIRLDECAGATDDDKLTTALALAQASTPRKPIRLSSRAYSFTRTRTTFSGLRIYGPGFGWQNPEISGTNGVLAPCTVTLNCGTGASSWLVGTSQTYDVAVAGITFKSTNGNTQFYHHPYSAGTCYAAKFANLTFLGFKHVMGLPSDPMSITLTNFSGEWTCVGVQGTQFSLRGSDSWLWTDGNINYGWQGANAGQYLVRFSNLSKSFAANMYLTARGGSRCILVEGPTSQQGGLTIRDCVLEGQNAGDPAMGALVVVKGGGVKLRDICLNFGMYRPSDFTDQVDTALIMVQGGTVSVDGVWTNRANNVAESVPIVAVSGGRANVKEVYGMGSWSSLPRAVRTGGTLVTDQSVTAA